MISDGVSLCWELELDEDDGCAGVRRGGSLVSRKRGGLAGVWWGNGARETRGRKLQAEEGRCETRVKISEMSRCCTLVS